MSHYPCYYIHDYLVATIYHDLSLLLLSDELGYLCKCYAQLLRSKKTWPLSHEKHINNDDLMYIPLKYYNNIYVHLRNPIQFELRNITHNSGIIISSDVKSVNNFPIYMWPHVLSGPSIFESTLRWITVGKRIWVGEKFMGRYKVKSMVESTVGWSKINCWDNSGGHK